MAQRLGETSQLFVILRGLAYLHTARADFQKGQDLFGRLLHLAEQQADSGLVIYACQLIGTFQFFLGILLPRTVSVQT